MKKRLLCLVVCLLIVLPVILTGCNAGRRINFRPDLQTITLCMIKGENTTEAGIQAVEDAINKITEPAYTVHVELICYTADEYYDAIDKRIQTTKQEMADEIAAAESMEEYLDKLEAAGEKLPETEPETEAGELETYLDEDGDPQYVYPEAGENQIDIFLVTNNTKFVEYADMTISEKGKTLLYDITEKLNEKYKSLRKIINPIYFNATTHNGAVYGIPNNHIVGEYTYLLLNKDICTNQLNWAGDEFNTLTNLQTYLRAVETYCPDVTPLYNLPENEVLNLTDEFSLLGSYYVPGILETDGGVAPRNVLLNSGYSAYLSNCFNIRKNGWVEEGSYYELPADKTFGAAFLKGGANIKETYGEDYYVIDYAAPIAGSDDIYASSYVVTNFSKVPDVCLDIIAKLTTDPVLRNAFQYGTENVTYTVNDETGMIVPKTEGDAVWDVDPIYTGNLFLLKQNALMSEYELKLSANDWAQGKSQNAVANLSPYSFFPLQIIDEEAVALRNELYPERDENGDPIPPEPYEYMYTQEILDGIAALTKDIMERLNSFEETVDENGNTVTFVDFLRELRNEVNTNEYMKAAVDPKNPDSIVSQYDAWYSMQSGGM